MNIMRHGQDIGLELRDCDVLLTIPRPRKVDKQKDT